MVETNNAERLLNAGITPDDLVLIADGAVFAFDRKRKNKGAHSGPLGASGRELFRAMLRTTDYEADVSALLAHQPYKAESLADRVKMSRATVGAAINRLIENGFAEKQRIGRSFRLRLLLPSLALTEYGEYHIGAWEPKMVGYLEHHKLATAILVMYPIVNNGEV